jgi:hypothetical protein
MVQYTREGRECKGLSARSLPLLREKAEDEDAVDRHDDVPWITGQLDTAGGFSLRGGAGVYRQSLR